MSWDVYSSKFETAKPIVGPSWVRQKNAKLSRQFWGESYENERRVYYVFRFLDHLVLWNFPRTSRTPRSVLDRVLYQPYFQRGKRTGSIIFVKLLWFSALPKVLIPIIKFKIDHGISNPLWKTLPANWRLLHPSFGWVIFVSRKCASPGFVNNWAGNNFQLAGFITIR